jgi:hypothetical protein
MEGNAAVQFIKVTKESVLAFLREAKKRVVIAKAGYFVEEIETLLCLIEEKVRCDVYVDTDEKTIRYGFGEQEALELVNENLELLHVQSANYIRMAIIIVDETVMVYSPVALSWEEVPEKIDFPNGFIGGSDVANSLLRQIEGEPIEINIEGMNIAIQTCPIIQKVPEKIKQEIETTISVLKENPPVDPAELRKTTFYRHKYKLLKMTLHGVQIKNKSISLRAFNKMFPKTNLRLKSSWNVLTREDVENLVAINDFLKQATDVTAKHTFDAKRYGILIELKNIRPLENCIAFLVYELVDDLMSEGNGNESQGKTPIRKSLVDLLKESRIALIDHLYPQAMEEKECWDQLFANDRTLYRQMQDEKIQENIAVKQAVETYVDHRLNFPKAQEMIDLIHVEFDYYDISDELLAKDNFVEIVEGFDIKVRDYQEGYEKIKQMTLFEFSD